MKTIDLTKWFSISTLISEKLDKFFLIFIKVLFILVLSAVALCNAEETKTTLQLDQRNQEDMDLISSDPIPVNCTDNCSDISKVHQNGEILTEPMHVASFVRSTWNNIRSTEDRNLFKNMQSRHRDNKVYLTFSVNADSSLVEENVKAYLDSLSKIRRNAFKYKKKDIEKTVANAATVYGYYHPQISINLADEGDLNNPMVIVDVKKGPAVKIRNVEAEMLVDEEVAALLEQVRVTNKIEVGHRFDHNNYESYKSSLIANAVSKGYLKAKLIINHVRVYPEENVADIYVTLEGGKRFKISEIRFNGFEESHDMARKLISIKPGDYYDSESIAKMNHNLYESGYFRAADIQTARADITDDNVPLVVELAPKPYTLVETGIGFSTDEGPRFQLSEKNPWLNSSGHTFNSSLKLSPKNNFIDAKYMIPRDDPLLDYYVINPRYEYKDNNDTVYDAVLVQFGYVTKTHGKWERNYFIQYGYDDFNQGGEHGNASLLMPGVTLSTSDMQQNTLDPSWGYRFSVTGKASLESFISNQSIAYLDAFLKVILSPTQNSRLLLRYEHGMLFGGKMDKIPPRLRFFAGGDLSIRGYGFEEIAPKNYKGELLGGRYLSVGSVEFQLPIMEGLRLATFLDVGSVTNDYAHSNVKYGTGIGVRYISPVGPIRLDIGAGVNEVHMPIKLHFGIGPEL